MALGDGERCEPSISAYTAPVRCFYSPDYFFPLPAGHPFPMRKFPDAHRQLVDDGVVTEVTLVDPCDDARVQRVHHSDYLARLRGGRFTPRELTQLGLPAGEPLYRRSALEVEGTRRAAWAALDDGIAANLAGGTHHAFPDHGEGFCVLNDVAIAVRDLQQSHPALRIFICDTDAHQGNGSHAILGHDPNVFTYSIHVGANYPSRKVPGSLDVALERYVGGDTFSAELERTLPPAADEFRPDIVFWISGADPHRNDRFGQMQLSARDLILRDQFVLSLFLDRQVPVVVLYGGGYNREIEHTARIHAATITLAGRLADRPSPTTP